MCHVRPGEGLITKLHSVKLVVFRYDDPLFPLCVSIVLCLSMFLMRFFGIYFIGHAGANARGNSDSNK